MAPDVTVHDSFSRTSLMSDKLKHSLLKKIRVLKKNGSGCKNSTDSGSSESADQRLGKYPPKSVMSKRKASLPTPKMADKPSMLVQSHTRHASLIHADLMTPVQPRKVASVPSMPDTEGFQLSSTPTISKRSSAGAGPSDFRCSKCGSLSFSASHSAGNAAVVKPSDRRSQHKFHKLFNLDHSQPLIKSFPCALVGDILFQGTFYASEHFFCFHSKFAKKRKLIQVAIREVTNLTREKTAGIIPNAIAIHTKHSRFMFASIIGRESIFRLLTNLWDTQLSMSNTMKWDSVSPSSDSEALSPSVSRASNKVFKTVPSQVSNDGVLHDSSADTELDTEDDDDAEDDGVQITCTPSSDVSNGVSKPDRSPSRTLDPSSSPSGPMRTSSVALFPGKPAPGSMVRPGNHSSNSSFQNLSKCLREVWSIPRMQLSLFIAYILLIFLAFSAIVLAWRVHTYQVLLHNRMDKIDLGTDLNCHSNDPQCNLYRLRQQTHTSRIRHVQAVMNTNIRTLNTLARRLHVHEPQSVTPDAQPESPPS